MLDASQAFGAAWGLGADRGRGLSPEIFLGSLVSTESVLVLRRRYWSWSIRTQHCRSIQPSTAVCVSS